MDRATVIGLLCEGRSVATVSRLARASRTEVRSLQANAGRAANRLTRRARQCENAAPGGISWCGLKISGAGLPSTMMKPASPRSMRASAWSTRM